MKILKKLALAVAATLMLGSFAGVSSIPATAAYQNASDVEYVNVGKYVANWGTRDEDCTFLSEYAEDFYTGNYSYDVMSKKSGGSTQQNAHNSALYSALKSMMVANHSYQTSYNATRDLYRYTDCEENNYSNISSFYSGRTLKGEWDSGKTWNREHTWPNSKGMNGNDENDIMMLRPTSVSENSSRGNKAYGISGGYYDPNSEGQNVRGDCARIVLYVYVRWGNTARMWGSDGVIQSMSVLLDWMEEDPVDTWEMGRNDAVESITGTRNVFVDYPEYAWLLFGKEIPTNISTPSGENKNQTQDSEDSSSESEDSSSDIEDSSSESEDSSSDIEDSSSESEDSSSDIEDSSSESEDSSSDIEDSSSESEDSSTDIEDSSSEDDGHRFSNWIVIIEPTETKDGLKQRTCLDCGETETEIIPKLGGDASDSADNSSETTGHNFSEWIVIVEPTETEDGLQQRTCLDCGETQTEIIPKLGDGVEESEDGDDSETGEASDSDGTESNVSEMGCSGSMSIFAVGGLMVCIGCTLLKRREDNE